MIRFKIYLPLLASLALAACQGDPDTPTPKPPVEGTEVIFSGSPTEGIGSRTELGDEVVDGKIPVYWAPGDALGVLTNSVGATADNARAALSEGAGTQLGTFSSFGVTMAETDNVFHLYFPHVKDAVLDTDPTADSPIRVRDIATNPYLVGLLPSAQTQSSPNRYDQFSKYGISVAVSDPADKGGNVNFVMKHMLSYLEISLWGSADLPVGFKIAGIEIVASDNTSIAGLFRSDFNGVYSAMTGPAEAFSDKVAINVLHPQALDAGEENAQKFLASMLPVNLTNKRLTVYVRLKSVDPANSMEYTYKQDFRGIDLRSGVVNRLGGDISSWKSTMQTPVSKGLAQMISKIGELEALALQYISSKPAINTVNYYDRYTQWMTAQFLRTLEPSYNSGSWTLAAGAAVTEFNTMVQTSRPDLYNYFKDINTAKKQPAIDPWMYGGLGLQTYTMDLYHMMGTLTGNLYKPMGAPYPTDGVGWGGDLITFSVYTINNNPSLPSADAYKAKTLEFIAKPGTTYDMDDLSGDADAINLALIVRNENIPLTDAMMLYYSSPDHYLKRFTLFRASFGDDTEFKRRIKIFAARSTDGLSFIPKMAVQTIQNAFFGNVYPSADQGTGISDGYFEYIETLCELEE